MKITDKATRFGFYYTMSDVLFGGVPLLLVPIVAYYLLPGEFALYSNLVVLMAVSSVFIDFGSAGYYGVIFHKKKVIKNLVYFDSILIISINTLLLLVVVSFFIDNIVNIVKVSEIHIYISIMTAFFMCINSLYLTKLRFNEAVFSFVLLRLAQVFIHAALTIALVILYDFSWIGRYLSHFIPIALLFIWVLWQGLSVVKSNKLRFSLKRVIPHLLFGVNLLPHAFSSWIKTSLDRFFLSDLPDLISNGVYSMAFQISMIVALVGIGFNKAFAPEIFKRIAANNGINGFIKKITFYNLLFTLLTTVFFLIYGDKILPDSYNGVAEVLPYLLIGQGMLNIYIVYSNIIFYFESVLFLSLISVFSAIVHVLILINYVPVYYEIGAGMAFFISSFIQLMLTVVYVKTKFNY